MTAGVLPAYDRIVCGDHLSVMSAWPDGMIDLTVTSPPYDELRDYNGYDFRYEDLLAELYRITKEGGQCVWIVADSMKYGNESLTSFRHALTAQHIGWHVTVMIFEKTRRTQGTPAGQYFRNFEYMFRMCKGPKPNAYHPIQDVQNSQGLFHNVFRYKDGAFSGSRKAKRMPNRPFGKRGSVWYYEIGINTTTEKYAFAHPAVFPEPLIADLITSFSNKHDLVLDPMCGSGTTCKMSKVADRRYLGIDVSQEYVDIARRRTGFTKLDAPHVVD
ncbi:MAG: site-specific DNA-methyltransferase [Rhodospirillaceae bacterium]|nr:site-specific DNA-methyltransferase [Rhodospirillaceae bacterium]